MDVSVIMLAFQQSKSYEKLEVPQIQLIVGVLDIPVVSQRCLLNTWSCENICMTSSLTCVENNNNNYTIWGGSVLTGEEPPPHSGELKHALPQAGGPTQSQLSRPASSGHHISMEHRLRRKQLNSDSNASNKKIFERNTRKKKRRNFFFGKIKKKMKTQKLKKEKEHF